jgi:hypothetical protein
MTAEPTDQANYDPTGEAATWESAAALVSAMKRGPVDGDERNDWDTALTQAARALETEGRKVKQRNGMYYRVLDGKGMLAES